MSANVADAAIGLRIADRDSVRWITLSRPEVKNALNGSMLAGLVEAVDCDVAAIVITGEGSTFSSGLDLKAVTRGELPAHALQDAIRAIRAASVPTIAAVNGPAITAGMGLALACDFAIASDAAVFADSHGKIGVLSASGITSLLVERIGSARAKEMSLTARLIDAQTAEAWGLVNTVVPSDQLESVIADRTRRIAAHSRPLMRAMVGVHAGLAEIVSGPRFALEASTSAEWAQNAGATITWERPTLT